MRENALENLFRNKVRDAGGIAVKLMATVGGVPDRLVLAPGGRVFLVELKKTHQDKLRPLQVHWHVKAAALGVHVVVLHGAEEIRAWVKETFESD